VCRKPAQAFDNSGTALVLPYGLQSQHLPPSDPRDGDSGFRVLEVLGGPPQRQVNEITISIVDSNGHELPTNCCGLIDKNVSFSHA
jgi:hypothetical protein